MFTSFIVKKMAIIACALFIPFAQATPRENHSPQAVVDVDIAGKLPVIEALSQVIYYREKNIISNNSGANIYVDGEFHTSLLTGSYTAFCIQPGKHILETVIGKGRDFYGEKRSLHQQQFLGGKTYYFRVNEQGNMLPDAMPKTLGEQALLGSYPMRRFLDRASSTESCFYDANRMQPPRDYALDAVLLFGPDSHSAELTLRGRQTLADLALALRTYHTRLWNIKILPTQRHSLMLVPINQKRAEVIKRTLAQNAIAENIFTLDATHIASTVYENCMSSDGKVNACLPDAARVLIRVNE